MLCRYTGIGTLFTIANSTTSQFLLQFWDKVAPTKLLVHSCYMQHGVTADLSKISTMHNWRTPKAVKSLRRFLGLKGYCQNFVKIYGLIARPLISMLKTDSFKWTDESKETLIRMKQAMANPPVLSLPDFNKQFIIECDASRSGIDAVLTMV